MSGRRTEQMYSTTVSMVRTCARVTVYTIIELAKLTELPSFSVAVGDEKNQFGLNF